MLKAPVEDVFFAVHFGIARLPEKASILEVYGVAVLCGIGFTMSLFIGLLAFDDPSHVAMTKLAVLAGSVLSALVGLAVMMLPKRFDRTNP